MAVTFDNSQFAIGAVSGGNFSFTVGNNSNRVLLVAFVQAGGTLTGSTVTCSYAGTSMGSPLASDTSTALFGLVAPAIGANNVSYTFSGTKASVVVLSAYNADQTGGTTTFHNANSAGTTGTNIPVTITSAVGEIIFSYYINSTPPSTTAFTTPGNGTDIGNDTSAGASDSNAAAGNWAAGASPNVVMSYNMGGTTFGIAYGVSILQFTGGPPVPQFGPTGLASCEW